MPKSLQRPVVLLTGASSGYWLSTWRRYWCATATPSTVSARRVEKIEELASEGVKALSLDVPMKHPWKPPYSRSLMQRPH